MMERYRWAGRQTNTRTDRQTQLNTDRQVYR